MRPDEVPNEHGRTVNFPMSYRERMKQRNGGHIKIGNEVWSLFRFRYETEPKSIQIEREVVQQTLAARQKPGIPKDALVIADNPTGDLLVFVRGRRDFRGIENHNKYSNELYRWDHTSHDLVKIASDFNEVAWGPDQQKN